MGANAFADDRSNGLPGLVGQRAEPVVEEGRRAKREEPVFSFALFAGFAHVGVQQCKTKCTRIGKGFLWDVS